MPEKTGAGKYHGAVAEGYDAKREGTPKWECEQRIIEGLLADLPRDSTVLDVPVGTGRFLGFYAGKGFKVVGLDLSEDMRRIAAGKADAQDWGEAARIPKVGLGDVRSLTLPEKSVDAAVMVRLTRWLSPFECQIALTELQRVTRKRIIWTARVANEKHPHLARPVELFEAALHDGWRITRNEEGYEPTYRILMAEREAV